MCFYRWSNILLCVLIGVSELQSKSVGEQFFLGKYPSPKEVNSPIAIETDKVNKTSSPPLFFRGVLTNKVKLINTGTKLEVIELSKAKKTVSHVSRGILGNVKYLFGKTNFLWTDDPNGVSATTIDGKGFRMEAVNYFYNEEYGSFENSLNYRDGLVVATFPIIICDSGLPSLKFIPFVEKLKEVREPGNSTFTKLGISFIWYDVIPITAKYYAYPGAYKDEKTGQKYYCQINIVFPNYPGACINNEQFAETFGSMKDLSGNPLTSTENQYPSNQPVIEASKVLQLITLTDTL